MKLDVQRIKPIGRRVLVRPTEWRAEMHSGIHLPETSEQRPVEAVVVALGDGKDETGKRRPFKVHVGQAIAIPKWGGTELMLDRARHVMVHEDDLLGILDLTVDATIENSPKHVHPAHASRHGT